MGVHHFLIETSAYLSSNDLKSNLYCRHSAWYIKCTQTREAMSNMNIVYQRFTQNLFDICQKYNLQNEKSEKGLSVNISCDKDPYKAEIVLMVDNQEKQKMKFALPIFDQNGLIGCLKDMDYVE